MAGTSVKKLELVAAVENAVDHANRRHNTAVLVEMRVENECLERLVGIALRGRGASDDGIKHLHYPFAGLGRNPQDIFGRNAEHIFDFGRVAIRLSGWKVDLVEASDNLKIVLHRQITIGEGLGLNALSGVDHQDHAFACGKRAAHFVTEVDVTGRVDQVDDVAMPAKPH